MLGSLDLLFPNILSLSLLPFMLIEFTGLKPVLVTVEQLRLFSSFSIIVSVARRFFWQNRALRHYPIMNRIVMRYFRRSAWQCHDDTVASFG